MSNWLIVGLLLLVCALVAPAMATVDVGNYPCPATYNAALASCTANDVVTTIDRVQILNYACGHQMMEMLPYLINTSYETTANERYDLGIFLARDGGSVQGRLGDLGLAQTCVG